MTIIGWKRINDHRILVDFDTREERDAFEKVLEGLEKLLDADILESILKDDSMGLTHHRRKF